MDIQAAKKRCEARLPTMGWTSSGNRYLTAEGHDYIRQLRTDCTAALEALEEAQGEARKLRHWARDFPQKRVWVHIVIESCNAILGESE